MAFSSNAFHKNINNNIRNEFWYTIIVMFIGTAHFYFLGTAMTIASLNTLYITRGTESQIYTDYLHVDGVLSASCSENLTIVGAVCSVVFYLIGLLSAVLGFIIYSKICQRKPPGRDNEEDILSPSPRGTDVQLEDHAVTSASDPTRETNFKFPLVATKMMINFMKI